MLVALAAGIALPAGAEEAEEPPSEKPRTLAVVTHVENDVVSVSRSELARIFLKQQTVWPDGERCIPIDQRGDSAIRREFSRLVLQQTVYETRRYWMQETMTGNAKPPVSLESTATVKKYLQKLKGAVAYIYLDEVDDSVRVLAVSDVEELAAPDEPEDPASDEATGDDSPTPNAPLEEATPAP
ncbi:MAG: hypothetical protein KF886_26240 [Candidatus Hydrogenedentes bacterium]|nr:hypothetical protein [Candidatus Hydrogenedentota bacterium]